MPNPADGKSVSIEDVRPVVEELVAAIPKAVDGKDAEPVDPSVVAALIIEDVAKLIPVPADGKSVALEDVLPALEEMVEKRVAAIPRPKDGVGTAGAVIDRSGELVLTLSDGSTKALGVVVGKDADREEILRFINEKMAEIPRPKDGRDGFGFEDLDATFDGERTIALKFTRGDQVKEFSFKMPVVIDRGVYKEVRDQPYEKGDGVTFGGSFWIAQKDAPEGKPQDGSNSWRLSVKRGRNGADGVVRTVPPQGPVKSS
jgi:predicted RecA/RadA family phage recombinase